MNEATVSIGRNVVNRLRQVTSAIKQEGANQVNIITSTAEREAAVEFAKAAAIRPEIVGATLHCRCRHRSRVPLTGGPVLAILRQLHTEPGIVGRMACLHDCGDTSPGGG